MTVDDIINACECALESANEHSTSATDIWNSVKKYIPKQKQKDAATSLADQLCSGWEKYLENVT